MTPAKFGQWPRNGLKNGHWHTSKLTSPQRCLIQRHQNTPYRAVVFDGNYAEAKAEWLSHLEAAFPTMTFDSSFIGPAIGCHTGSGVLGVAWAYDWQTMTEHLLEQRALTSSKE